MLMFFILLISLLLLWKLSSRSPNANATTEGRRGGGGGGGGVDVSRSSSAEHLVVMVHGILGCAANWNYVANQFVRMFPGKVIVHCSECNMFRLTLDGIDVMGERLAEEVLEVINKKPEIRRISFVAHSVGGLVARYAIGRLYRPPRQEAEIDPSSGARDDNCKGTICGLEAVNFITFASPHLGSRGNGQVPFLCGIPAIEKLASYVSHWVFGRTGTQLFLADINQGKPPLLLQMVDDCSKLHFMSALQSFKRRVAYSNVGCDHIVGWRTSSIRRDSELPRWKDSPRGKYPHVVYETFSKGDTAEKCGNVSLQADNRDMLEEKMVTALSQLSWEKVDVSFHRSMQRFDAHSAIQVKVELLHSDGADVIRHLIDRFVA